VVETSAKIAVERAQDQKPGKDNLTWGTFVTKAVGPGAKAAVAKEPAKKEAKPKSAKR
jgi:hypothetical protein